MERRLAAILAADMVGYSRLMAIDEGAVLDRQRRYRRELIDPKIQEYRGRIVKTTGDGLLAEFPSVIDAVRCAVGIQRAMSECEGASPPDRRIAYRIGVNLGDIIIEDGDIYGDGVNIAARLEAMADPGGIFVSGTVVDHVRAKVASGFEDCGEQSLKNIPLPVRVYRVLAHPEQPGEATAPASRITRSKVSVLAGIGTAIALGVIAGAALIKSRDVSVDAGSQANVGSENSTSELAPTASPNLREERASVAVLPFQNMSQEADQEYFADGITEDIITSLSKFPEMVVISRNSTFRLKGQEVDPKQVGTEFGVLYVLTGSVRRGGDDVRINAQLIDARSGGSIWAERYDAVLSDVLALQGEVADKIANALALSLTPEPVAESRRGETSNARAYDLFLRGWEHFRKRTPEHQVLALDYFKSAIDLDPGYARAHAAVASVYWTSFVAQWPGTIMKAEPDLYGRRDKAYEHLAKAMEAPPTLAFQVRSKVGLYRGKFEESLSDASEAVTLDRNDADALTTLAEVLILLGLPEEGFEPIRKAERLDPYNRSYHSFLRGTALFGQAKFDEAASNLEKAIELGPEEWSLATGFGTLRLYSMLAASYAYLHRTDATQKAIASIKSTWNKANIATELYYWHYKEEADRQRLAEGLRLAGFPEF